MPRRKVTRYPEAQERFIRKTRQAIDSDTDYFDDHDWRLIIPTGGKRSSLTKAITTESFYVKPIAAWVPDMLFENHVPCCPNCKTPRFVDVTRARWINHPKLLFGVSSHRYLDTKLYPCRSCGKRFTGYNRESMHLDEEKYVGFFNFYLSSRFAVEPFQVAPLVQHQQACPLDGFRQRKYCSTCGWQKAHHDKHDSFGSTCRKDVCGNCNRLRQYHSCINGKVQMGPFCTFKPHSDLFERHGWYTMPKSRKENNAMSTII